MKVLLVNPPTLYRWQAVTDEMAPVRRPPYFSTLLRDDTRPMSGASSLPGEHLGLQSLAASLRAEGHDATIIDACGEFHCSLIETAERLRSLDGLDIIGFTGPTDVIGEVRWLIHHVRDRGFAGPIVVGNDHASLNAQLELDASPGLTHVLRGEAEQSLPAFVAAIESDRPLTEVPGLSWRTANRIQHNPSSPSALDLDQLPRPVRDRTAAVVVNGMSASMFTKRGCPYRCAHCTTGQVASLKAANAGANWRAKSPSVAAAEFLELADTYGLDHITIVDDLFVAKDAQSHAWAYEFSELLIDARNRVSFMVDCRVDSLDEKLARSLWRAGLRRVFIGAESGSSAALSVLNKQYRGVSPAAEVSRLKDLGLEVLLGFIFMTPGDTVETIRESVGFLESIGARDYRLFSQRARIYPGSLLESRVRQASQLRGEYPFYRFEYTDPQMKQVGHVVKRVTRLVGALVEEHAPLVPALEAALFSAFADSIRQLCTSPPRADSGDDVVEQLIDCMVTDCWSAVDQTGRA